MANEALVQAVKEIASFSRSGKLDDAYQRYEKLFGSAEFSSYKPDEQRQALRLMVLAKGAPEPPSPTMAAAHAAAAGPLAKLVAAHGEPSDYEMLGLCHLVRGDEAKASEAFRAGLTIERERNPQSDLCGALMKRVSLL
jgi:hypothetical protein